MKKSVCLFLCFVFLLGFSAYSKAIIVNDDFWVFQPFRVLSKDLTTGEITETTYNVSTQEIVPTRHNILTNTPLLPKGIGKEPGLQNSISPLDIVGDDDRELVTNTKAFPYSAICYLKAEYNNNDYDEGTAFMISDNIAITAAHCIYANDGELATQVKVWPGKDGDGWFDNPYGSAKRISVIAPNWTGWSTYQPYNDWAIIELNENIGNRTGYFEIEWNHTDIFSRTFTISGYPDEDDAGYIEEFRQYKDSGYITTVNHQYMFYSIDTGGGQSGAPIFHSENVVYGIHIKRYDDVENLGIRITKPIYLYLMDYINTH